MPTLSASSLRRLAVVGSDNLRTRELVAQAYANAHYSLNIEVRHFTDMLATRVWACDPNVNH